MQILRPPGKAGSGPSQLRFAPQQSRLDPESMRLCLSTRVGIGLSHV
jgi:hypothetical protein